MTTSTHIPASVSSSSGPESLREYDVFVEALSNSGISLQLDPDVHRRLQSESELIVRLNLPGADKSYRIACLVKSRSESGDTYAYGCEFDWSATMDPLAVVEDLLEYTMNDKIAS